MTCNFKFNTDKYPALKGLERYCGTNTSQFFNYIVNAIHPIDSNGNIDFTEEFKREWNKNNKNVELSLVNTHKTKLRKAIVDYYNATKPNSQTTNRKKKDVDKVAVFGYTNVNAREKAKLDFVNAILTSYHLNENKGKNKVTENLKNWYVVHAIATLNTGLANELSKVTGIPAKEILANLNKNDASYITDILKGHEDKVTVQLENRIATYREYSNNDFRKAFIEEVLLNSKLSQIRFDRKEDIDVDTMNNIVNEESQDDANINTEDNTNEESYDDSITNFNNKLGQTTNFMTHVGAPLRALLGSLRKMTTVENSEGKLEVIYDTDNYTGIPECMDDTAACSVLYTYGKYDSPAVMLQSLRDIADQLPGYAAFSKLADILTNDLNLQWSFYRTFKKLSMGRAETVVENGAVTLKITGTGDTVQSILYNQMFNSFKGTSLTTTEEYNREIIKELVKQIGTYNPTTDINGKEVRKLATSIAKILQVYFPQINDLSIRNYILYNKNNKGEVDYINNINVLFGELESLIKAVNSTKDAYLKRQSAIIAAIRKNGKAKGLAQEEHRLVRDNELIDLTSLYTSKYITTEAEGAMTRISKLLAPYTVVNRRLNQRDIYGHQKSTIINDSMMTNIINILQSDLNNYITDDAGNKVWNPKAPIIKLAEHRSKSKQYDFSNILIEHTDDKGNIINKGLFRKDKNGTWIPTEYAKQMLTIVQYSGGSNRNNLNNASYADMSQPDYLSSAWKNFFSTNDDETAGYFPRIPSDAPNTFVIVAPKYSASGLLIEANKNEIDAEIKGIINNASAKTIDDISKIAFNTQPIVVSDRSKTGNNTTAFVKHIQSTPNNTIDIKIPKQRLKNLHSDKNNLVRFAFRYSIEGSQRNQNVYVMEGLYYDGVLHNASFVGFAKDSVDTAIWNNVKKNIRETKTHLSPEQGGIKWNIDTNHVLFKQLRNMFQQELNDMITAGEVMFKTMKDEDGFICFKYNTKTHAPVFVNGYTNTKHNGLHPTYHFEEKDDPTKCKIYETKDGKIKLLGKVFHSDRFIIYDAANETVRNFGEEILNELFNFFYGGAKTGNYLRYTKDKQGNIKVDITQEQEAIINNKIQEFILNYIEEARKEMSNIANFDNADNFTSENLAEFVLNEHLMYISFNDLFEGDTKFYKNTQTFLKRAKEPQGSGVGMAMADITRSIQSEHIIVNSPLDTTTFFGGKKVQMYDGFSGVTIYNTIKTDSPMLETLIKQLTNKKVMGKAALTEDAARNLLLGTDRKGGYQNTTTNDAQSYITFDEWIRRITGRGQLAQYTPLINRLLDESTPLNPKDLEEFVQVQKNFYYDQYYNANTHVVSPRQIKNAEFVLIPRLIKGTELEKIAQMMDKLGIDQLNTVETSKAGQGSRYTIWDKEGNLTEEIREDLANLDNPDYEWKSEIMQDSQNDARKSQFKEYFNYNYLYTQIETVQHIGENSENKAGIQILRKMLDNIDDNAPEHLRKLKEEYQALYSNLIESSFNHLMERLSDDFIKGDIKIIDGKIEGLDYKEFYNMLKDELIRLKSDSNMFDYCTIDENSPFANAPRMVLDMSLVGSKFENIIQSIFNRNITRQTLPGFHAAQITGTGFTKFTTTKASKLGTSNPLHYHYDIDEKGNYKYSDHIEIMMPISMFSIDRTSERYKNLSKEEQDALILKDLQEEGLDQIIGYRIPTEGKQSVCYMKIVGFIDEAYGSTIVVPDGWVSQTGSDMDGDSVYGIQYNTYKDKSGKIHKVKYNSSFNVYNWMNYVSRNTKTKYEGLSDDIFKAIKDEAKQETKDVLKADRAKRKAELAEIEEASWFELDDTSKQAIRNLHNQLNDIYGKNVTKEKYQAQLENEIALLNSRLETFDDTYDAEEKQAINDYIAIRQSILDRLLDNNKDDNTLDYNELKSKAIKTKIDEYNLKRIENYSKDAEEAGLLSLDEYLESRNGKETDDEKTRQKLAILANSRQAKINRLIEVITEIAKDPYTLEENLSRSNFDDITEALNKYNSSNRINAAKRAARSPYNIFSQSYYQEDAMSGRKLKGISVVRDNICSLMNTLRPILPENTAIKVAYPKDKYSKKDLSRFDTVEDGGNYWIVTHNTFGWTKDNKNVDGKILTSYSSQTTAQTLDAVKYGNVPNVNEYTFHVYKTIVDIGSNYDTAISFMMQPGITKIVEAYKATNSIYVESRNNNHIQQAIKAIADELNIEYDYNTRAEDIVKAIEAQYGDAFRELGLLGKDYKFTMSETTNSNNPLNATLQGERLAENGVFEGDSTSPVKEKIEIADGVYLSTGDVKSLYDLSIILQFNKMQALSNDINTVGRVSNPDKFGAKQTIFATRQILETLIDTIEDNCDSQGTSFRLQKDNKHILECMYPGITKTILNFDGSRAELVDTVVNSILNDDNFIENSDYNYLAAFLKCATIPSIVINQTLFETETTSFRDHIINDETDVVGEPQGLAAALSNGRRLTEEVYKDFKKYIVNYITLNRSRFLQAPLQYDITKGKQGFVYGNYKLESFNEDEYNRIIGSGYNPNITIVKNGEEVPFEVVDINNPTQEEVNDFAALTPAQKISWIQKTFDTAPLFNYIDVNLSNELAIRQGKAYQTIEFNESAANIEQVYSDFEEAFTNKNPFIALAAADIVKYAFYVENFRIGIGNVSKVIKNDILINDDKIYGTGIVSDLRDSFSRIDDILDNNKLSRDVLSENATVIENYIRGHYKTCGINYRRVQYINKQGYELDNSSNQGLIYLNTNTEEGNSLALKYNILYEDSRGIPTPNHYIRLAFGKKEILYRINTAGINNEIIYLTPLNTLSTNENSVWSSVKENDYLEESYYTTLMNNYLEKVVEQGLSLGGYYYSTMKEVSNDIDKSAYKYKRTKQVEDESAKPIKNINTNPSFVEVIDTIKKWYPKSIVENRPVTYIWNLPLGKHITSFGKKGEDIYRIKLDNNKVHNFIIQKTNVNYYIKKYTGEHIDRSISRRDEAMGELIDVVRNAARHYPNNTILTSNNNKFGDIYTIIPTDIETVSNEDEDEMFSTKLDKAAVSVATGIDNRARFDSTDVMANSLSMQFKQQGIKHNTKDIAPHTNDVIINGAKYLENTVNTLIDKYNNYYPNPEGDGYLPINDIRVAKAVRKNNVALREYIKDILEPQRILGQFGIFKDLNIDSEDPNIKTYLEICKKAINDINNLSCIKEAIENLANVYYGESSNDPRLRSGLISVLNGYHATNWFNATFNDIQESSNTIVQIAMRNFNTETRKAEMAARAEANEFGKHIAAIEAKAKAAGKKVNWDNIIDEYGRFKSQANQKFIEDKDRLRKAHLADVKEFGRGSIEELKSRLAYDEWKAQNVHQPLIKEYYDKKNAILRKALYGQEVEVDPVTHGTAIQGNIPELLSKYEQLREERKRLRNKYIGDINNPSLNDEFDKINDEIDALLNGDEVEGYDPSDVSDTDYLRQYVDDNRKLEQTYFKYDPSYNFEAIVEKNLKIVASFEQNGKPSYSYVDNPEYIKAKTWLRKNAELEPVWDEDTRLLINEAFKSLPTEKSFEFRKEILKNKAYRDKFGKFDPRLIPDDVLAKYKAEEIKHYSLSNSPISDKSIITNGRDDNVIYTKEFYDGVRGPKKSKHDNPRWQKVANQINELLSPYYNEFTQTIELSRIPTNAKGVVVLEKLSKLYDELDEIKGAKKSKATIKFIQKYVDEGAYNKFKYDADMAYMKSLAPGKFKTALRDVIRRENYAEDVVPNSYLYGVLKPKAEYIDKFTDKTKSKAIETLNKYYEVKVRPEFEEKRIDMYVNHPDEYNEWLEANTVYNPYTHKVQPLSIWTIRKPISDKFSYYPKFPQTVRVPRDGKLTKKEVENNMLNNIVPEEAKYETVLGLKKPIDFKKKYGEQITPDTYMSEIDFTNKDYKQTGGYLNNARRYEGSPYNVEHNMNEYEKEISDYVQNKLHSITHTAQGQNYLNQGFAPSRAISKIDSKSKLAKELLKIVGYVDESYNPNDWYDAIDYSKDKPQAMPMLSKLKGKNEEEIGKYPVKGDEQHKDETDEAYQARVDAWKANKRRIELETHKRLLDRDWVNVLQDFIVQAGKYNAVQNAKYELFFARTLLNDYGHYVKTYDKRGRSRYKRNYSEREEDKADYLKTKDTRLIEQFDNQIKRLVYDQWKERNNPSLLKWMSVIQGVTSAQYMMLNYKGGIANLTLGESSILQEVAAGMQIDKHSLLVGNKEYAAGIPDYLQHAYGGRPSSLAGTIIHTFDVIDYDENTGVSRLTKDAYKLLKDFRNFQYHPQTATEHKMQNTMLLAMLESHRIFEDKQRANFDKAPYVFKNFAEYVRDLREDALLSILDENETRLYNEYKDKIKEDKDKLKAYVHFRQDFVTNFAKDKLSSAKRKEFLKKIENLEKEAKVEFDKAPTILSQLSHKDGELIFKDGSLLKQISLNKDADGISYAYQLLAEMKSRVISVNKYIHGVYDKSGRAQIEKTFIGSLLMQYHKHLPVGIMKRYRIEGYFNEERGTVEKGIYTSLRDFLAMPFEHDKTLLGLTDENVTALQGVQNILKGIVDLAVNARDYYAILPQYDKANIKRFISGTATTLAAVFAVIAMKAGWDDDDSLLYNLAIYEADRLSTEMSQYMPITAWNEARKLYKSPIAAGSGITDLLASANLLAQMIIEGDDFDGTYHSGKFAGESKLKVYIERRIPIYRGIKSSFIDIKDNNKFYKLTSNTLGFINSDNIAEKFK